MVAFVEQRLGAIRDPRRRHGVRGDYATAKSVSARLCGDLKPNTI
jgi:hypothetical protein